MESLKIVRLTPNAYLPLKGTPYAAGYDLFSIVDTVVQPGRRTVVSTGIQIELPPNVYGRIAPRSGLSVKHGIQIGAGVIDPDYRGEIKVVLFNHDDKPFYIKPGYRIAQLVLERFESPSVIDVTGTILSDTKRHEDGFGSTGQ